MRTGSNWNPIVLSIAFAATLSQGAALAQAGLSPRMVEIEDRLVRVMTAGIDERAEDQPVVIFESGAGSSVESWNGLLLAVSNFAPVLAYDRPGIGQSEAAGELPEPQWIAEHLHALLAAIDVPPPYILVGHSWGGVLIHEFAGRYSDAVAGLIYVDPPDFLATREEKLELASSLGMSEAEYDAAIEEARGRLDPEVPAGLRADQAMMTDYLQANVRRELVEIPDVPLVVLLAWPLPVPPSQAGISEDHRRALATQFQWRVDEFSPWILNFSDATLVLATNAGHIIHNDDQALVADAIRRVSSRGATSP